MKSIIYKISAVVLISIVILLAYNVQLFRASNALTKRSFGSGIVDKALSLKEVDVAQALKSLFSKELFFQRAK